MSTEYVSMKADQVKRHKKVFTKWINLQLAKAKPPAEVTELVGEFRDGQVLVSLVEVLLGIQVTRAGPANKRINQIRNVQEAMRHLLRSNVKTTGIIASEITAGDERAILSLVWSIIQRFQINEAIQPDPGDYGVEKKLIAWCQEQLKGNSKKVHVSNLTSSWNDGLAFNALLHSFNPSLFDLNAISSSDATTRLTHAFKVATNTYGVPPLFDPEDVGMDTPDKNLITLFLSYLYQLTAKGGTVKIVKREITHPTEGGTVEIVKQMQEIVGPTETTKEYAFKSITTRQTSRSSSSTYNVKTITTTKEEKNGEVVHDVKTVKEGGQEKVLHVYGFPQNIQIEQREALVVSPFQKLTPSSSRASSASGTSSTTTTISKDSVAKEMEDDTFKLTTPPQISGEKSYEYRTVTTKRIVTGGGDRVTTSTTTSKTTQAAETDAKMIMGVTDGDKGKDNAILGKKGDNKDGKPADQRVTPDKKVKETEKEVGKEQKQRKSSETRDVLLISTERISGGGTPQKSKPSEPSSPQAIIEVDGGSDVGPARYFKYRTDDSTPPRSTTSFVDYLKKKLDAVDQSLSDLDHSSKHSDKDSMDLKATKNALDHHKEVFLQLESVQSKTYEVLGEGRGLVKDKCFDQQYEDYFSDRMDAIEHKMKKLEDDIKKEHQRLFDLYMILLKQHLERMNDWLVRAESRMALDDVIEPTHKGVQRQVSNHQAFQEELSNHSMVNMILEMDLEDPAIDETIRDWVKVLSERWAAVWNWAEEWKEKLNQALLDWNKLREQERELLSWLSSKEQTLDVIGETDITDEQQVKLHLNLLVTLTQEMETQGRRLESLHETGEQLIKDAEYHNSTAKGIRDQLEDFDRCWADIVSSIKERRETLEDTQSKIKQMGNLMREVRAWLDDAEKFIKLLREEKDPKEERNIQEKIETKCEERDKNQLKVDEINQLEDAISSNIDKTSNYYMKRVTKPFHKRWNDASTALNAYRDDEYPFIKPDDCFVVKYFKKALVVN